jgi:hypothetical protein
LINLKIIGIGFDFWFFSPFYMHMRQCDVGWPDLFLNDFKNIILSYFRNF